MPTSFQFDAIGTRWQIDLAEALAPEAEQALLRVILARIDAYDQTFSRFRSDSTVTRMAQAAGEYLFPDEAVDLFTLYAGLYELTNGVFTPLIGQTLVEAGYDAAYSLQPKQLTPVSAWDDVLDHSGSRIVLQRAHWLDFGAAGKGQLIDIIGQLLIDRGFSEFTIDAGGDMLVRRGADRPLRIGLEHPADPSRVLGVAEIANASICGSSGNRRSWGQYHHIFDPRTLASTRDILATWVVADSTMLADALATCLFLVPPATLLDNYRFAYVVVRSDYSIEKSSDFPGTLFV